MSKVMSDRDLLPTKRTADTLPNIKKHLVSPQTVRGVKETNASTTLKDAAK